jgi:hypothetical protein
VAQEFFPKLQLSLFYKEPMRVLLKFRSLKHSCYFLLSMLIPSESHARGMLDLAAILYAGLLLLGLYLFFVFFSLFISIPLFIFTIFDKKTREDLLIFSCGGFWYTFGLPVIMFIDFESASIFDYVIVISCWLFLWYLVARLLQYKEDDMNRNTK